jgi:uncharacterized membrane protein
MTEAQLFAIGILLAWLAGIRVYLTVFGLGLAGMLGWLDLPPALHVAQSPWVLGVSGVLAGAEFFADKIPGVDSGWDLLHTLLRVPVGAFLAAATLSPDGSLGAGMLATGAGVALTSHVLKAGSRALLNTSPEPVSNWTASAAEDVTVVGGPCARIRASMARRDHRGGGQRHRRGRGVVAVAARATCPVWSETDACVDECAAMRTASRKMPILGRPSGRNSCIPLMGTKR